MIKYSGPYQNQGVHDRVMAAFYAAPDYTRDDLFEALAWAKETLTNHEGAGHHINVIHQKDGVVCAFAKPQWNADHCSQPCDTASDAIVLAVCEYLNGA